jgi:hypothetical protein
MTLADFVAQNHAIAPQRQATPLGNTAWASTFAGEVRMVIEDAARRAPRSQQVHLGPSEIGVACDRQVAWKLLGLPAVNKISDPWPSIVGTAVHAWLDKAFAADSERFQAQHGFPRWLPERRVYPHPEHSGTADVYGILETAVIDWKVQGDSAQEKLRRDGPGRQYRTQLLLYGLGYRLLGLPVTRVVLVSLPPTKSTLDQIYVWEHTLTPADDVFLVEIFRELEQRKAWAAAIRSGAANLYDVPATTENDHCYFCNWFRPQSARDGGFGCPGSTPR